MSKPSFREIEIHAHKCFEEIYYDYRHICPSAFESVRFEVKNRDINMMGAYRSKFNRDLGIIAEHSIELNIERFTKYSVIGLEEYKSFAWLNIGNFKGSWKMVIKSIICHEIAHMINLASMLGLVEPSVQKSMIGVSRQSSENGHGDFFKAFYAALRIRYINSHVELCGQLDMYNGEATADANNEMYAKFAKSAKKHIPEFFNKVLIDNRGREFKVIGYRPRAKCDVVLVGNDKLVAWPKAAVEIIVAAGKVK